MSHHADRGRVVGAIRPSSRVALVVAVLLGGAMWLADTATAHSGFQSYVYVSIFDDSIDGRVEYPVNDLGPALDIDFPAEADDRLAVAREQADLIIAYTDEHLDLGDGDTNWNLLFDPDLGMLETAAGDYLLVPFEVDQTFDEAPRNFVATYSGIIESNPERDALFLIENDWGSATFGNEGEHLLGFSVGAETQVIDIEESSMLDSMTEVARRGSVAFDRSLVVLTALIAVLVGAVLGSRRAGTPETWRLSLARTGWRLGLFIAPMTVVLGVLGLSSTSLTERVAFGIGALGVLLAAASILLTTGPARMAVAASGAAAGAVLAQTFVFQQLDRSRPIVAFASFAAGAIATAVVVAALLLPLLLIVRTTPKPGLIADIVATITALAGAVWLVERLAGVKFPLRTAELTVADALTSPIIIGALTAIAAALAFRRATSASDRPPESPVASDHDAERIEA